jgi:predicted amidophosphoribosyltransferase
MKCPSCGAAVEEGADLCLECGEPMGESPAAKVARNENVIRPPADTFATPKPPPPPTLPGKPAAKKKWAVEEPEPLRCPGCGVKSHAERCPNCGNKMKHDS